MPWTVIEPLFWKENVFPAVPLKHTLPVLLMCTHPPATAWKDPCTWVDRQILLAFRQAPLVAASPLPVMHPPVAVRLTVLAVMPATAIEPLFWTVKLFPALPLRHTLPRFEMFTQLPATACS